MSEKKTIKSELTIGELAVQIRQIALAKMSEQAFDRMCRDFEAEIPLFEGGTKTPGKSIWRYQYLGLLHTLKNAQNDQRFIDLAIVWLAKHGTINDRNKRFNELLENVNW